MLIAVLSLYVALWSMKHQEALVELEPRPPTASSQLTRYVALLRAINVGGHTIKMDRLRLLFQEIGFQNVETFIASGNVIFEAPAGDAQALEASIEAHLYASLGYKVATFIRTSHELTEIASYQPFPAEETEVDNAVVYVAFLPRMPDDHAEQKLLALRTPVDDFHVHKREIYWLCRIRMSDSTFSGGLLEKTVGLPATMRNTSTVRKLAAKYGQQ
jgi:uncharacterized protein (DUF1697 family)